MTAGPDLFAQALDAFDTVVAYKGGRHLPEMLDVVRRAGRLDQAVYGAALGLPGERVRPATDMTGDADAPYLSTLLVPPARRERGGRL
jgi:precorrin-2/cobalt-factor-2 C20-methyltransferase